MKDPAGFLILVVASCFACLRVKVQRTPAPSLPFVLDQAWNCPVFQAFLHALPRDSEAEVPGKGRAVVVQPGAAGVSLPGPYLSQLSELARTTSISAASRAWASACSVVSTKPR